MVAPSIEASGVGQWGTGSKLAVRRWWRRLDRGQSMGGGQSRRVVTPNRRRWEETRDDNLCTEMIFYS
jgi:hypothetical protein